MVRVLFWLLTFYLASAPLSSALAGPNGCDLVEAIRVELNSPLVDLATEHKRSFAEQGRAKHRDEILALIQSPSSSERRDEIRALAQEVSLSAQDPTHFPAGLKNEADKQFYLLSVANRFKVRPGSVFSGMHWMRVESGKADLPLILSREIKARQSRLREWAKLIRSRAQEMGVTAASNDSIWKMVDELNARDGFGIDLNKILTHSLDQVPPGLQTWDEFSGSLEKSFSQGIKSVPESPIVKLEPELFSNTSEPATLKAQAGEHSALVAEISKNFERSQASGHTLSATDYIEGHVPARTMGYLLDHPGVPIQIFDSSSGSAFHELERQGFTEIQRLRKEKGTDFEQYFARNPKTDQISYAVLSKGGDAYQREIISHFIYYEKEGKRIAPTRISLFSEGKKVEDAFSDILKRNQLNPDIVMMGNMEPLLVMLRANGVDAQRVIFEPGLSGYVYQINGKQILSLSIEPNLYADRAGQFVRALKKLDPKSRAYFFAGTSGSLRQDMVMNDLILPDTVYDSNGAHSERPIQFSNHARDLFDSSHLGGDRGVHASETVGSVDTILVEDKQWFNNALKSPHPLSAVEQETHGIISALQEAQPTASPDRPYIILRVFDELAAGLDFGRSHVAPNPNRTRLRFEDYAKTFLKRELGENWQSSKPSVPVLGKSPDPLLPKPLKLLSGDEYLLRWQDSEREVRVRIKNLEAIRAIDPDAARVLEDQVRLAYRTQPDLQNLESIALDFSKIYHYRTDIKPQ